MSGNSPDMNTFSSLNPPNNCMRHTLSFPPWFLWDSWGSETFNDSMKVKQQISSWGRSKAQAGWWGSLCSLPPYHTCSSVPASWGHSEPAFWSRHNLHLPLNLGLRMFSDVFLSHVFPICPWFSVSGLQHFTLLTSLILKRLHWNIIHVPYKLPAVIFRTFCHLPKKSQTS